MKARQSSENWPSANLVNFPELFGDNRFLYIPEYQRPYDWGKDHRAALLKDISRLERLNRTDLNTAHFCGTVICTPKRRSRNEYAVVDGQQRITTFALLHARLCRVAGKKTFLTKPGSVRFLPQSQDEGAFTSILNGGSVSQATTSAQSNYQAADEQIQKWIEANEASADRLLELLETRMKFILFVLADENEVAKVFETINNRGKPLTQMDLVKNHLIYLSAINGWRTPNVNEVWRQIQQIVSAARFADSDIDAVLRATVTAQFQPGRRSAGETDFTIIARDLPEDSCNYEVFKIFVDFLKTNFDTYSSLRSARKTDPKDPTMRALTHLNHHDSITGVLPLIFARQFRRRDEIADAHVLSTIEKTNFRLYGLRTMAARSDSFNVKLHRLAHDYFKRNITDQRLLVELTSLCAKGPKDGLSTIVQSLTLNDDDDYDFYAWPWRRYFLARFEEFLLDRQSFDFDKLSTQYGKSDRTNDYLSVEHIWPLNAKDATVANYRERQQIRRLGNLMLLPHGLNITLSNNTPGVKNKKLGEAKVTMLRQNIALADAVKKAECFVGILQNRNDTVFGARRKRFNAKTIERNGTLSLVKTICDLREEAMIAFALNEWRLPGETGTGRGFAGMFSFAHLDEAFCSERETASNKLNENYVLVADSPADQGSVARLNARNSVLELNRNPILWR
jgi:hypothetical protein